jgi:hypothetical protein
MIRTVIADGLSNNSATITSENALMVNTLSYPAITEVNKVEFYRSYLTTTAGSNDMKVNGSVAAPIEFYIKAIEGADRYITQLSFLLADPSMVLNEFAHIAALTNGCTLTYNKVGKNITIHEGLKTNFDIIRLCIGTQAFGATTNAFIASNVSTTAEGIIPILDLTKLMPPFGIKLDMNSIQRISLKVQDNLTGINAAGAFNVIAYGFDRYE